jgi:putative transposase
VVPVLRECWRLGLQTTSCGQKTRTHYFPRDYGSTIIRFSSCIPPLLASITGSIDEELRLRNAYLEAENRVMRHPITARRVQLTDAERKTLAAMDYKLGRQALEEIATVAKPDTILAWHRTLMVQPSDNSQPRKFLGRPRIDQELEALVVRMARENRSWGYDRIVGALANLGYRISDQTVGNILKRHGIPPAPSASRR